MRKTVLALLLALVAPLAFATPKKADIVITGGTVLTMAGPDIADGAVAIKDGKIVAVGKAADVAKQWIGREVIHARGQAVIPGFVNTHTHVPMALFRGIADDRDLMDWLHNYIFPAEAKNVARDFVKWGTRLAAAEMIRGGTTTFADMYYFESDVARETKAAGLRGVLGETVLDFPAPDNKTWDAMMAYCRAFAKEWKGDRLITPAIAPHAPYTVSEAHLRQVRELANELRIPIEIHVSETRDELTQISEKHDNLTPGLYLDKIGFLGPDVIAAHGVWLNAQELRVFAERHTGVAHNPISNMMLASGVAPVVEMRKAGMNVGLGTDGPAGSGDNMDMIQVMATAARLQKVTRYDPKALSARDVLEMATIDGARVLGLDKEIGTLEPGKRADIAIINLHTSSTEPVYSVESAIVYAANAKDVTTTICDGKVLMRDHKLLTVDEPAAIAKARFYRDKVLKSLKK